MGLRDVNSTMEAKGARRPFRVLLALAAFTALLMAMSALAPLVVGGLFHHENMGGGMAADMSAHDALIVCALVPSITDWHIPALVALPICLLAYVTFSGAWDILAQWQRTQCMTAQLRQYRSTTSGRSWEQLLRKVELAGNVDLIEVDRPLAFCYGWLSPRVCISTGTLAIMDDIELEAILLHERFHLLRRDPLRNAVSQALARVFFFLPLIGALQRDFVVRKEIEADRYVLEAQKRELGLLGALSKMIMCRTVRTAATGASIGAVAGPVVAGSTECVDHRIDYLLKGTWPAVAPSKRSLWVGCFVIGILALVVVVATWHASSAAVAYQQICNLADCGLIPLVH